MSPVGAAAASTLSVDLTYIALTYIGIVYNFSYNNEIEILHYFLFVAVRFALP